MKKINGYYQDENGNKWDEDIYSEIEAQELSSKLINCKNCVNCSYCSDCSGCSYCSYCSGCSRCSGCSGCSYCSYCSGCSDCSRCSGCSGCSGCSYCSGFLQNPRRYTGQIMGSRKAQTTTYWTDDKNQVVCGCFKGTIEEFKNKVQETHRDSEHAKAYQKYIAIVEMIMKMEL